MQTFAQARDQLQRQASRNPVRLNAVPSGSDYRTQPILELQRSLGNRAVQRLLGTNAQELGEGSSTTAVRRFTPAVSRASVVAQAPVKIQHKLAVNAPGDVFEQEADRVAKQVMSTPGSQLQRTCTCGGECARCQTEKLGRGYERLYTKNVELSNRERTEAPPIVHEVLQSPGQPIDLAAREFMAPRFGCDFSRVQVHADEKAADSARAVGARAYTFGQHVVFGAGEYQPASQAGRRLLAHELTHVTQQSRAATVLQRQKAPTTTASLRVGIIPVREFIQHVETVERAYPTKSPQEILTMIRSLYYGSPAGSPGFDRLIPDAPNTGAVEICTDSEGTRCEEPVGTCLCVYAQGLAMDVGHLRTAVSRLRQHANENEIADNPSPYIEVGGDLIDVGHLLVGVDAILHPRTATPFSSHGLTSASGPATWEGDVGAGMVYLAEHRANGGKSADVKGNPSPTVQSYYRNSTPMSDILGDVDAFGMASLVGQQTLSSALRRYYVSESGGSPRYQYNRWAGFCAAVGLTYTQSGGTITWTPAARQRVIDRITAFANLFQGRTSPMRAMMSGIPPRIWPEAGDFADLFLADVKSGLEREIAAHTGP